MVFYNVINFGAKPDGKTDSSPAFLNAWSTACASLDSSTINVPKGRYLIGSLAFKDYRVLGQASNWLSFEGVSGVTIIGGALDAKGSGLWACKAAATNCPSGATTLSFTNSYNIRINGLLSLNSQMYHIVFNGCQNVHVERIKIIASGNSPNTDSIHVQLSSNVAIVNSTIKTGDDCISIGPGTNNLWIEHIKCGPNHGIRLKSWARPSSGFVQRVHFLGAVMQNVQNPIVIDQNYCPHNINCPGQAIRGTSATQIAIKFDCSATGIRIENVNLIYPNQPAQSFYTNAIRKTLGSVQPNSCL
ncbi:hypothetical protein ACJW31_08G002200 [Castanea mollissima]